MMKTIQITLPEELLSRLDHAVSDLDTTRSALAREAFEQVIARYEIEKKERQHAEGYAQHPVEPGEFDVWQDEQDWGSREAR